MRARALVPLQTVKLKINGACMNRCSFCRFHGRPERLTCDEVARVVGTLPEGWRGQVLINGGEPTLHPDFEAISRLLKDRWPHLRRGVGTNLRLFERQSTRAARAWQSVLDCYDLVQIGCDDAHHNIDIVERLVPRLRDAGLEVYINSLRGQVGERTSMRLQRLDASTGSTTRLSPVFDHNSPRAPHPEASRGLCAKRRREVLVDCDGKIYFCFHHGFARPIGDLHTLEPAQLADLLLSEDPRATYQGCQHCERWIPDVAAPASDPRVEGVTPV